MPTPPNAEVPEKHDPRLLSALHLEKLGIIRLNRNNLLLQCVNCQTIWSPDLKPDGMLRPGYWRCPFGCNR